MSQLDQVISDINKKYKTDLIKKGNEYTPLPKIPFSSPRANYLTYGGVPIGKSTELFGPESGGKTTTAIDLVANAQRLSYKLWKDRYDELSSTLKELKEKNNKSDAKKIKKYEEELTEHESVGPRKVVYVDAENTLDEEWATLNGVDIDNLYLIRPEDQTAEEVLQMIIDLIKSGEIILLVLDSVPMLVGQNVYEEDMSKKSYGGISGPLSEFSRRISAVIAKNETALVSINQVREDMDNPFNIYKTPGGRAWKHLHGLRIYLRKGSFIDERNNELKNNAEAPHGNLVNMQVIKTKVSKPDRRMGFYTLKYNEGIDYLADTVDLSVMYDFVVKAGAWYKFIDADTGEILSDDNGEELKFQGRASLLEYLREHDELFEELRDALNAKANEKA